MFAFMLQLSFYQNIFHSPGFCAIVNTSTVESTFFIFEILNGISTKPQHEEQEKSSCKINQWDFSSSNELSSHHVVPWWIKYPRETFLIENNERRYEMSIKA